MHLIDLIDRKAQLQQSLTNIQQSFHIVTGHLAEVDYQIKVLEEEEAKEMARLKAESEAEALANESEPAVE